MHEASVGKSRLMEYRVYLEHCLSIHSISLTVQFTYKSFLATTKALPASQSCYILDIKDNIIIRYWF